MTKLRLQQPGFTYSTCELLTKHRKGIPKFRETSDFYIYKNHKNQLDNACFGHDSAYADSNDLAKRTFRSYEITLNSKGDGHQRELARTVYNFLDTKI